MATSDAWKVAVVTGAGGGIGRCHALELASRGYSVVVNDIGVGVRDDNRSDRPARQVVDEILESGGSAIPSFDDVADWDGAKGIIDLAFDTFGRLDVLVNNAGILRDRMLVNLADEDWDDVIRVHLRGTFGPTREAARRWRGLHKAGESVDARVINTSSTSGLFGNPGQANYGAAKAGIAALTVIGAMELQQYGVTMNALAPGARTRMTEGLIPDVEEGPDPFDPWAVSRMAAWLAGPTARGVTGRVFFVQGGQVSVLRPWEEGPTATRPESFTVDELDAVVPRLLEETDRTSGLGT